MYNSMKGPSLFKHGSLNRFGFITLINIYRVFIYKISFPDNIFMNVCYKTICFTMAGLSSLGLCLPVSPEAYPKVEHHSQVGSGLTLKH
jgi:hypothetical protein